MNQLGRVFLVGAGPGDPGLLTLRGAACLAHADIVLYDYLVNPQVLEHAPPLAERVCLGRHGRDRLWSQEEINARLVSEARAGHNVVRLKGGDPAVFARAADEVAALAAAGVPYEIVPGLTAALATGSYAGIPLTHRDQASAVALITGQEQDEKPSAALDYAALAAFPGTLVFYMGVTSAPRWSTALIEHGKPVDTPAAVVRRCTWPDQSVIVCKLGSVATELTSRKMRPPVIVIVGDVAAHAATTASWFATRPLAGARVLVTRPAEQSTALRDRLQELGADVLVQPAIGIGPPDDWTPVDDALARIKSYDWLVFSSANGVRALLDRLLAGVAGGDVRRLGSVQLAAIGPGTADELAAYCLHADLIPETHRAEDLADALAPFAPGRRFLLARASRGRELLAERLRTAGGHVDQVVVYTSSDVVQADPDIARAMSAGQVQWVTVTSSAIAKSLVAMFGADLRKTRLASISPVTTATLVELGYPPAVEAQVYTMRGVIDAIVTAARA